MMDGDETTWTDSVITCGCLHPDCEEVFEYFREGRVYAVQIESNLACQQGCRYCYASGDVPLNRELPSPDVLAVIDSAARMGVKAIDWLGGDPLLRRDWFYLMEYAKECGLINNIWTSGIPLADPGVAEKAHEASAGGFISVHLDSLNEEIYGVLHTGDPTVKIDAVLAGVENLQSLGKAPREMINCITFTKPVAGNDVVRTIRFFFEEKGMRTCLTQICPVGLARERRDWIPNPGEVRAACEARDAINYPGSPLSFGPMDTSKFYCGGMVCVTVDGDVTPCSVIRKGFGNIHERSLAEIVALHRDELLFLRFRDPANLPGYCSRCEQNEACWGCRASAFYETGNLFAADPRCWRGQKT
jgi:radical SAM protein with 4Fe4S-binding SPASM domain